MDDYLRVLYRSVNNLEKTRVFIIHQFGSSKAIRKAADNLWSAEKILRLLISEIEGKKDD